MSDKAQVRKMFAQALQIIGRIDILLNNASGSGPIAPVAEMDMETWIQCMHINLVGAMYCLQEAAQIVAVQKSGSIINMSSLMGVQGYPMRSAYVASKFALIGVTETMARELGPLNVRVNALMPGAVSGENMNRVLAVGLRQRAALLKRLNGRATQMSPHSKDGYHQKRSAAQRFITRLI